MKPLFFATPAQFRAWLTTHHAARAEQWVGFYKKGSGRPSITWPQSVDEALCFGWIDGLRKTIDERRYMIRFTPRKPSSAWSAVNLRRVAQLRAEERMTEAGLAAFERRPTSAPSAERATASLSKAELKRFETNATAWAYWSAQPPSYCRTASYWVISAKQAETRERRLTTLIDDCAAGQRIKPLRFTKTKR